MLFSYLDKLLNIALNLIYVCRSLQHIHVLRQILYNFALMMFILYSSSWQLEAFEPQQDSTSVEPQWYNIRVVKVQCILFQLINRVQKVSTESSCQH